MQKIGPKLSEGLCQRVPGSSAHGGARPDICQPDARQRRLDGLPVRSATVNRIELGERQS
jgi:hypothetical protein